ncbi:MAG TPA: D-glycero-beta-D-manno-heptose 1-phosphate adenylyltransferase [Oligoflexia bacterium]|nr:D-glycero-beta-D-manno-heptose 1-phosphate adenylyltransferase [Oligoflexia bacterium]HMP49151.1 D-glycero-beta-D-manno-heptose 1-phosphate adenylyltransferase [Oligoflexia bacterium]
MNEGLVFTNGCFDVLHVGHVRYLRQARDLGSSLMVGLNSDESVRRLKGPKRPIHNQEIRREMLLSLKMVDEVVIFEEDTPLRLIMEVNPEIIVKGGDWTPDKIVGADFVVSSGGKVFSLPFFEGFSSTDTIQRILDVYKN